MGSKCNVWDEVKKVCKNIKNVRFSFITPLCVENGQQCEDFPTNLYSLPCFCTICENCHSNLNGQKSQCPFHRTNYWPNKLNKIDLDLQDILRRKIHCPKSEFGCHFTGNLNDIELHEEDCCYLEVLCPLECGKSVYRKDLQRHILDCCNRIVNCDKCGIDIAFCNKDTHDQKCNYQPRPCKKCSRPITEYQMRDHMDNCDQNLLECQFSSLGCTYKGNKVCLRKHENLTNHVEMLINTCQKMNQMQDDIKELKQSFAKSHRNIINEIVDSAMEDLKKKLVPLIENTVPKLTETTNRIDEERPSKEESCAIPVSSKSHTGSSVTSFAADSREVIAGEDELTNETALMSENIDKLIEPIASNITFTLEQKMPNILENNNDVFHSVAQTFIEILKIMLNACLERLKNTTKKVIDKYKQDTNKLKTLSADFNENPHEPVPTNQTENISVQEVTNAIDIDSIAMTNMDDLEKITCNAVKYTTRKILNTFQQSLLDKAEKFEEEFKNKIHNIIFETTTEMMSCVKINVQATSDQLSEQANEEISKNLESIMKEMTSKFHSIVEKSCQEIQNVICIFLTVSNDH